MPPKKRVSVSTPSVSQKQKKTQKNVVDLTKDSHDDSLQPTESNAKLQAKRKRFTPEEEVSELKSSLSSFMKMMKVEPEQVNSFLSDKPPKRNRKSVNKYQDENFIQLMSRENDEIEKDLIGSEGEDYDSSSADSSESRETSEISIISNNSYKPVSDSDDDEELVEDADDDDEDDIIDDDEDDDDDDDIIDDDEEDDDDDDDDDDDIIDDDEEDDDD